MFDGNSQAIDHILVGGALSGVDRDYDVVHVNSEFFDQVSDHDPQVASFELAQPTVSPGGPYTVDEGSSVALHATGNGTIHWDLDNDGIYETTGPDATFDATALDGPATKTVGVESVSPDGTTATATTTVTIRNVAADGDLLGAVDGDDRRAVHDLAARSGRSVAGRHAAGFTYAFDCGAGFGAYASNASASCTETAPGTQTVRGRIKDTDGGVSTYSATVDVGVNVQAICSLTVTDVESSAKYKALAAGCPEGDRRACAGGVRQARHVADARSRR